MMRQQRIVTSCLEWLWGHWLMLLYVFFVFTTVHAQEHPGIIINPSLPDTAAINQVMRHAGTLYESAPEEALKLFGRTLNASKDFHYNYGIAKSLRGIGNFYTNKNDQHQALPYLRMALQYSPDNAAGHELVASIYLLIASNYFYRGQYDSCIFYRYSALDELELHHIMNPRAQLNVYASILQYWLNANEDVAHDNYIVQVMEHINGLEQIAAARRDSVQLGEIWFRKAGYYNKIGQNDSSRYYAFRSLAMDTMLHASPSFPVAIYLNIGHTYIEDKQPTKALFYFDQAIARIPEADKTDNRQYIFARIFMGEAYCQLKDYEKAIAITGPALEQADHLNIVHISDYGHKTLAKSYEAIGEFQKSAEHWRQYSVVRDSLIKAEKMEIGYMLEMKYRIADKNKELAEKELAITINKSRIRSKNFWIGGISMGLLLLSLLSLLLYRNNHHQRKLQAEKIRNLHQEAQIASLQSMINGEEKERSRLARELHDGMGGMLGTIRTRVSAIFRKHKTSDVTHEFTEVLALLEEASAELRKTAHNLMPEILLREGLSKASILFTERIRKGHKLDINTEIWGDVRPLPKDLELTAYRMIQELVHNILKHAGATQALVQLNYHQLQLSITVEDNGNGLLASKWKSGDGMGLKTIQERVRSLNGEVDIASNPGRGTSIYIEMNIAAVKQNKQEI